MHFKLTHVRRVEEFEPPEKGVIDIYYASGMEK